MPKAYPHHRSAPMIGPASPSRHVRTSQFGDGRFPAVSRRTGQNEAQAYLHLVNVQLRTNRHEDAIAAAPRAPEILTKVQKEEGVVKR